ncbi:hypothetical protein GWM83_01955, partial [Candidatus Bathyarchaeota archaeon]|nr:hypothetical protein [Candidatus Bathyarchaeota archaeon]NIR15810.1 hypothetical protein [Desulfobacterales bacterium]NIV67702.1 hypothetical protein [Candidatus Bathyarchaeota archaeon]NIW34313.1 hypothetical protein [Candidatus Bathyarchaeota archaeon]
MQTIRTQIRENIQRRSLIVEALKQLRGRLHPPFFPFFNGRWELIPPEEFNASDGTPLGVAFAFNLTRVRNPQWKFAEGNVLIKCRFYYTPVTEVIEDVSYTVQRAEMKMDFVITEWKWNIDVLIQVIEELNEEYGMDLPLPNVERAGLALWLDLTSFNATGTEGILEIGEGAESVDEATSLKESITEMIEASQHLIETMEEGYEELEEGREEIQEELAAGNPDWVDIQEQILEMIDDSIEDVIEELKEDQMTINETLSTIQEIVEPETYEQIEANISGILASVDSVVGRLEALNGTLNDLLEVEEVATFNYNLSSLAVDYQQALVDLRTAVTTGLQDLYQRLMDMGEKIAQKAKASRMKIRDRLVDIKEDLSLGQERPLDVSVRLGRLLKIGFATENTTLAGWFQFVNFTRLTYPDGENTTAP